MANPGVYLDVDISDAMETISALCVVHTQTEFEKLMYRAFSRTGRHVKTILKKDLPKEYNAKASWIGSQVGAPRTELGGVAGVSCSIPIKGTRGTIGGTFNASGGAHGWNAKLRRYKVSAQMVKGQRSTMPSQMSHQGGNPPFRNLGSSLGGLTFTRTTDDRLPIARVAGIGVPQMPLNRSEDDVQTDIMDMLMKRLEHEHERLIAKCR